jgi:hypothetical protein
MGVFMMMSRKAEHEPDLPSPWCLAEPVRTAVAATEPPGGGSLRRVPQRVNPGVREGAA